MSAHAQELSRGERFQFGANWARFLELLNDDRIAQAERSLRSMLGVEDLNGKTFLDVGSGSGLFSLAARRLGAKVHSFDYDPQSVACTRELKRRYFDNDAQWMVEEASALDPAYLSTLGTFDIVYSWGVLHHTGAMWQALGNVEPLVAQPGRLFIAIYNDQGRASVMWARIKRLYCRSPKPVQAVILGLCMVRLWGPAIVRALFKGAVRSRIKNYGEGSGRGMSAWRDLVDWVGGYPFEVATPEQIFDFYRERGFQLERLTTCGGGLGCNQFVFRR